MTDGSVQYLRPFLAFTSEKIAADRLARFCREVWNIPEKETRRAAHLAWEEQQRAKADVRTAGAKALADMEKNDGSGIVLAGRPYHVDPEINHGIPELIAAYGLTVLTEDCLPIDFTPKRPVRVTTSGSIIPAFTPRRNSSAGATILSSSSSIRSAADSTPSRPTRSASSWSRAASSTPASRSTR